MLKFLKNALLIVGLVLILAGAGWLGYELLMPVKQLWTAANANKSNTESYLANPSAWIALASLGTLIGGFLLGLSVAMPARTFKQRLEEERGGSASEASQATPQPPAAAPQPPLDVETLGQ